MKIVKTAKLKILTHTKTFDETIKIYNQALSFYIIVCEQEQSTLQGKKSKEKLKYIESMIKIFMVRMQGQSILRLRS